MTKLIVSPEARLMDSDVAGARGAIVFGPFRLHPAKRLLEKNSVPVALGSRALDVLVALVERAGEVVGKQELTKRVWSGITVDESSLRVHVAMLRKVLGDGRDGARYVTNVSGRGYCFVAPIAREIEAPPAPPASPEETRPSPSAGSPAPAPQGLPHRLSRMIGREATVRDIRDLLAECRFVTLHGAGGMGKTTVAVAVAHAELARFVNEVAFVDLVAVGDPALVASAVASVLGVAVQSNDPVPTLLNFLRSRRLLLVLDNCEHVIDSVARLAESIFCEASEVSVLATSREPLRVEGEHVYRLSALETPPLGGSLDAAEVLGFAAASLFVERAGASGHQLHLNDADAALVAEICCRLDGNPLAIELAAGRVGTHGLQELAKLLDSQLRLLWQGRRTALPRHQTLNATLDWSYNLIPETERTVLRRLAVLVGGFTLQAAEAVAMDGALDASEMVEALEQLVAKSLIQVEPSAASRRYRLLDTMRTYARSKLIGSGEERATARRHAAFFQTFLEQTRGKRSQVAFSVGGGSQLDRVSLLGNVRAALDWCFAEDGDQELGIQLAATAAPLLVEISLLEECRRWAERALAILEPSQRGTRFEMELQAGLGHSLMLTSRNSEEAVAALERSLVIAAELGDRFNEFRALKRLHQYHRRTAEIARTLEVGRRMEAVAGEIGDPIGRACAHMQLAVSYHLTGDQVKARSHLDASTIEGGEERPTDPDHFALYSSPHTTFCRVFWLQGYPDQAFETASLVAKAPLADDDPATSCNSLIRCASVLGWCGDWAAVEQQAERVIAHAGAHFLVPYRNVGLGLRAQVLIQRGQIEEGISLLQRTIASLERDRYRLYLPDLSVTLVSTFASQGRVAEAFKAIEGVIGFVEELGALYTLPELLRAKGEIYVAAGDERQAEALFRRAFVMAEEQGALSWRLRVAMSMTKLGREEDARERLADIFGRFTEGFATADLQAAKALLA